MAAYCNSLWRPARKRRTTTTVISQLKQTHTRTRTSLLTEISDHDSVCLCMCASVCFCSGRIAWVHGSIDVFCNANMPLILLGKLRV